MFTVTKRMEVAGTHKLNLSYDSPCTRPHGHNWIITVEVTAKHLNINGIVIDFSTIDMIVNQLDHQDIDKVLNGLNSTAENIACWVRNRITEHLITKRDEDRCEVSKVTVQESEGNIAVYTPVNK